MGKKPSLNDSQPHLGSITADGASASLEMQGPTIDGEHDEGSCSDTSMVGVMNERSIKIGNGSSSSRQVEGEDDREEKHPHQLI